MPNASHLARVARNPIPAHLVYGYEQVLRGSRNPEGYLGALYAVTACGKVYTRQTKNPFAFHNPTAKWKEVAELPEVVTYIGIYELSDIKK